MMYNLIVTNPDVTHHIADFLTRLFGINRSRVFAADDAEQDSWDWEALSNSLVSCQYSRKQGDLAWSLDIYAVDEVDNQPSEQHLALRLAQELRTVALFPEGQTVPSVRQLATPRGELMHARLEEPEDEDGTDEVSEVEAPVPELPHAAVARFPDIIKAVNLPTPITDSLFPDNDAHRDLRWTHSKLVNWERLTIRMTGNWPPSAWYPASMYADDLRYRDGLDEQIAKLPAEERAAAEEAKRCIDDRYRELTVDDAGAALIRAGEASPQQIAECPWYWRRRPDPLPWEEPA